ncbi:hypothetical protein [Evansella halocellulosilytica]|uniref:hypothetical protein n=1 Tax=Evansella halocellulosilytica TaxID=2011013 RepID=UPI000BB8BB36|nr:hypothetical protein [Evansella halocellulosilytica]
MKKVFTTLLIALCLLGYNTTAFSQTINEADTGAHITYGEDIVTVSDDGELIDYKHLKTYPKVEFNKTLLRKRR